MASVNVPGVCSWGNRYCLLVLGVLGLSPCHGGGLRRPLLFGPQTYPSPCFQCRVYRDVRVYPRFLKPRLLTHFSDLPTRRHLSRKFLLPAGIGTVAAGLPSESSLAPSKDAYAYPYGFPTALDFSFPGSSSVLIEKTSLQSFQYFALGHRLLG